MSQKNDNFIDKTFTVLADILLKVLPATKDEKQAFSYYRYGMSAQANGDYAEALENYYEALKLEEDAYDRSYILYNIGLIYSNHDYVLLPNNGYVGELKKNFLVNSPFFCIMLHAPGTMLQLLVLV